MSSTHPPGSVPRILILAAALSAALAAASPKRAPEAGPAAEPTAAQLAAFREAVDRPLVLEIPGSDRVRITRDAVYRTGGAPWQLADVYLPPTGSPLLRAPFPVVVLVHGGVGEISYRPKDWGLYQSWGRALAASGFAVIAFNHRLGYPEPRIAEAHEDLEQLLSWMEREAGRFELDPKRVGLAFYSAGGLVATPYLAGSRDSIKALVAFYPIFAIEGSRHLEAQVPAERRAALSPLAGLDAAGARTPPMWIARAGQDAIPDLLPGLDAFIAKGLVRGVDLTVANHPSAPHGFDNADPSPRARAIIRSAITFLEERLRGEPDLVARTPFVDYDPPQTLVVPAHPKDRARFPFVDVHSHQFDLDEDAVRRLVGEMDAMNMAVMVNLSGRGFRRIEGPDGRVRFAIGEPNYIRDLIALTERIAPGRIVHFTSVDFSLVGTPEWPARAVAELEADVAAGARGLKIYKGLGMDTVGAGGARLAVDDPRLAPIFEACARLGVPVLIHTADPFQFWQPRDRENERLYELIEVPGRTRDASRNVPWEQLIAEQHALFRRHPRTRFINAHLGWLGNDLARLGRLLDECPNVSTEIGAVLAELGRQPRFAREWITRYQDRVLFGKDSYEPSEYPAYFRVLETADDSFPYYRRRHAFWKIYGLDLPEPVLRKVYSENARRLIPGLGRPSSP